MRETIYDKAVDIKTGEIDISGRESLRDGKSELAEYAETAADVAVRQAVLDDSYDVPDEAVPDGMNETPTHNGETYDSPEDFPEGTEITFIDTDSNARLTGEVRGTGTDRLIVAEDGETIPSKGVNEETLEQQILEIHSVPDEQ